jgi:hypothetical protein
MSALAAPCCLRHICSMADPEIPEVRAELQREDAPAKPGVRPGLGSLGWLLWAFGAIVIAIIVLAYALG